MKKVLGAIIIAMVLMGGYVTTYAGEGMQGVLNLNTATMDQLVMLFDHETALKIEEYHKSKGNFKGPRDILQVEGINMKGYMTLKRYLVVEGPTTLTVPPGKMHAHGPGGNH